MQDPRTWYQHPRNGRKGITASKRGGQCWGWMETVTALSRLVQTLLLGLFLAVPVLDSVQVSTPVCWLWRIQCSETHQHCLDHSGQCLQVLLMLEWCSGPLGTLFRLSLVSRCPTILKTVFLLLFQVLPSKSVHQIHQWANHPLQFTPYLSYQLACIIITPYCQQLYNHVLLMLFNILLKFSVLANHVIDHVIVGIFISSI